MKVSKKTIYINEEKNLIETVVIYEDGSSTVSTKPLNEEKPVLKKQVIEDCKTCKV